jgi:hypothetical protein
VQTALLITENTGREDLQETMEQQEV